jgi:hypothetical protein
MTKINFTGATPVYLPVSFRGHSGLVYGLNVFPGEQSVEDDAWAEMQKDSLAFSYIQAGSLSLALQEPVEVPEETAPASGEQETIGLGEGSGEESNLGSEVPLVDPATEASATEETAPVSESVPETPAADEAKA